MTTEHHHNQSTPFRSYPQKYAKSQQAAKRTADRMLHLMQRGPQSTAAIVVDTSYHASQGYVTCTTNHVVVNVYGVPYGSVIPQMRLFIRQMGSHTTNRPYIFDGFAPNISSMGHLGSVMVSKTPLNPLVGGMVSSASAAIGAVPSLPASAIGYYWHLYFFLPTLPTATITLMQMQEVGTGTTNIQLEYLVDGRLQFRSQDNHGLQTNVAAAPHSLHWVLIQPGHMGAELLVDGVANYTGLAFPNDEPTFTGGASTYTLTYLSTTTGANAAPIGSWVSKMGFGASSASGGSVVPLIQTIPQSDADIPTLPISTTQAPLNVYLCEDAPGSGSLANSAGSPTFPGPLTVNTAAASIQQSGPY